MLYGVSVTTIFKGRVRSVALVCSPCGGDWHHVALRSYDEARELCFSMRRCQAKYGVPNQDIAYTVVPLPACH